MQSAGVLRNDGNQKNKYSHTTSTRFSCYLISLCLGGWGNVNTHKKKKQLYGRRLGRQTYGKGPMGVLFFPGHGQRFSDRPAELRGERPPRRPTLMVSILTSNAFRRVYTSFGFGPLFAAAPAETNCPCETRRNSSKCILAGCKENRNSRAIVECR